MLKGLLQMSKTKEQCMNIISDKLSNIKKYEEHIYLNKLKESIKEITNSEYGLLWFYDVENKLVSVEKEKFEIEKSILNTVLTSKKGLYENHIKSHKFYNPKIDNPLNINIKSVLILPILDKEKNVLGFISAVNSKDSLAGFRRYDLRLLSLLNNKAEEIMYFHIEKERQKIKDNGNVVKDISKVKKSGASKRKTKADLELELKEQEKKIKALESLLLKKEEYEIVPVEVVDKEEALLIETKIDNHTKIEIILDFLTKEMSYLNKEAPSIYFFLEIIRNSLHNKETLSYLEEKLMSLNLRNTLVDNFYTEKEISVIIKEFKLYAAVISVANLYSHYFTQNKILFNIFIDPTISSSLESDITLIQSLMIHLLNNINSLVKENGVVELLILFSEDQQSLAIEMNAIQPKEQKQFSSFFHNKSVSNSVVSGDIGLGLSVSSNLLKILGGKLKLTTKGENEHSFIALIPVGFTELVSKTSFKHKRPTKIAVLMNSENSYAYNNLYRYLKAFGIDENNIVTVNSYKKLANMKIVHFFCFENMLTDKMSLDGFKDITILKYSDQPLSIEKPNIIINELYLNAYYGMELQKILFPDLAIEEIEENTLLREETFLERVSKRFKG